MKKIIIEVIIIGSILSIGSVRALEPGALNTIRNNQLQNIKLQATPTFIPLIKPSFIQLQKQKNNLIDIIKDKFKKFFGLRFTGTISSVSDNMLVVKSKEGKDWNVYLTDKTQIKRRFGGQSSVSEFIPNDEVAVVGRRQQTASSEPSETDMDAKNIRNLSIQRRNTVFIGDITSVNSNDASFTIETKARGLQTVYKTKDTVVTENGVVITFESLTVGERVIVKGELWDRTNTKINAKKIMKLVLKPVVTPTP